MKRSVVYLTAKKNCLLILLIFLIFIISMFGCTNVYKTSDSYDYSNSIQTAVYEENNIIIKYPQIGNETIDQMLKDSALGVLKYYSTDDKQELSELLVDIDYSIKTFDDKVLSVVFRGTGQLNANFDRINRYEYSININMKSCEKLRLSDFIDINEDFISVFRTTVANQLDEEYQAVFDDQSDGQLLKNLLTSDTLDMDSDIKDQRDIFSYISNDDVYIIYPVPYAAGDCITIKL